MSRLPVALVLLCLAAGGLWGLASLAPDGSGGTARVDVFVLGRDAEPLANGTVTARGDPLSALRALAAERGFAVEVERQTWVGPGCTADYVVGIAGLRETAAGGWNYYVRRPGGSWEWSPAGASCHALSDGDQVEWCWVEADRCGRHVP